MTAEQKPALFRPEAALSRVSRFGRVALALPVSSWLLTLVLAAVLLSLVAFLIFGRYARKETVGGYVTPSAGAVDVYASRPGVVDAVHVALGERVQAGERLFSVRDPGQLSLGGDVSARVGQRIERQIANVVAERGSVARLFERKLARLDHALIANLEELAAFEALERLARQRLDLAEGSMGAREALARSRALSDDQLREARSTLLSVRIEHGRADAERRRLEAELPDLRLQRDEVAAEKDRQIAILDVRLDGLRGQLIEWRAREASVMVAPVDGVVAMSQVASGQAADVQAPAMTIIPEDGSLVVRLLIPTRAKAFVEPGQNVRLMYDAFPYQHFGMHDGVLAGVSTASVAGHQVLGPLSAREPVYLGLVHLDHDRFQAYGRPYRIQSGMTVKADIVLAERRLITWLLEPLLRVRG